MVYMLEHYGKKILQKLFHVIYFDLIDIVAMYLKKLRPYFLYQVKKKRTTIDVAIKKDKIKKWNTKKEYVYIITRNEIVIKIGGTRNGMNGRWSSYCCGHYVSQRLNKKGLPYPGKMSMTNAHLYHTIEDDLLHHNSSWKFYIWDLPIRQYYINIFGKSQKIIAQTYHAYEKHCIHEFKKINGCIPMF